MTKNNLELVATLVAGAGGVTFHIMLAYNWYKNKQAKKLKEAIDRSNIEFRMNKILKEEGPDGLLLRIISKLKKEVTTNDRGFKFETQPLM